MERERNKKLLEQNEKAADASPDSTNVQIPLSNGNAAVKEEKKTPAQSETFQDLIRKEIGNKLEETFDNDPKFTKGTNDGEKKKVVETALVHLMDNVPKLAFNRDQKKVPSDILSSLSLYPQLQEFTKNIIEDRYNEEIEKSKLKVNGVGGEESVLNGLKSQSDIKLEETNEAKITVPSYPPVINSIHRSDNSLESTNNGNDTQSLISSLSPSSLKDVIAQIISQKLSGEDLSSNDLSIDKDSKSLLTSTLKNIESTLSQVRGKSEKQDSQKKRVNSPSSGGKGSRPKRGKYRNYDRDNLLKAVRAVQSGEMSVHRAGSFYGVPHSTLEYKVKERHLNRGRGKKDNASSNPKATKNEKTDIKTEDNATAFAQSIKEQLLKVTPDTTTVDLMNEDNLRISEDTSNSTDYLPPPSKKAKVAFDKDDSLHIANSLQANPFLSPSFGFWNSASPFVSPFLAAHYQPESFYATHMIRRFHEAAAKTNTGTTSGNLSGTSTPVDSDRATSPVGIGSVGSQDSPSAVTTPNSVLDSLLQSKATSTSPSPTFGLSPNPWQVNPSLLSLSRNLAKENQSRFLQENQTGSEAAATLVPPPSLVAFNALLPSVLAARSSLAAAFQRPSPSPTAVPSPTAAPSPISALSPRAIPSPSAPSSPGVDIIPTTASVMTDDMDTIPAPIVNDGLHMSSIATAEEA